MREPLRELARKFLFKDTPPLKKGGFWSWGVLWVLVVFVAEEEKMVLFAPSTTVMGAPLEL